MAGIDRRGFLMAAGAGVLSACQAPDWARGLLGWFPPGRVVDIHCHIFNADDLAVKGFLANVVLRRFGSLGRVMARALDYALQRGAPGFSREDALLDDLLSGQAFPAFEAPISDEELIRGFTDELRRTDEELYQEMLNEMGVDPQGFADPDAALFGSAVHRVLRWGHQLTFFRVRIAEAMLDTYPAVDLFTPAMVDMDLWVNDDAKVPVRKQLLLYGKLARWSNGRIHPLVAFDPRREVRAGSDSLHGSLHWVKQAVEEHGAVGVKLYPPMGFRATGNANSALDRALEALYSWCEARDVPIMAHCNRSNGATDGAEDGADPHFWRPVLEKHPRLRLDLGHFGGTDELRDEGPASWTREVAQLMQDCDHVYGDFGFHDVALDASEKEIASYLDALATLRAQFPKLQDRALYGSDWQMIMMMANHEGYLSTYSGLYQERFGSAATEQFRGENALRFLGLDAGPTGNRKRLADFYRTHEIDKPAWWREG